MGAGRSAGAVVPVPGLVPVRAKPEPVVPVRTDGARVTRKTKQANDHLNANDIVSITLGQSETAPATVRKKV